jgi:hypothetical protein
VKKERNENSIIKKTKSKTKNKRKKLNRCAEVSEKLSNMSKKSLKIPKG